MNIATGVSSSQTTSRRALPSLSYSPSRWVVLEVLVQRQGGRTAAAQVVGVVADAPGAVVRDVADVLPERVAAHALDVGVKRCGGLVVGPGVAL